MTRTVAREIAIQLVFAVSQTDESVDEVLERFFDKEYYASLAEENELYSDYPSRKHLDYISKIVHGIVEHQADLDKLIEKYSKGWKLKRISRIASSIMRTAMYEIMYMDDVPDRVAINEAVELAKGYEEQETVSFINGILGSFLRGERNEKAPEEEQKEEAPEAEQEETPELEQEEKVPEEKQEEKAQEEEQ